MGYWYTWSMTVFFSFLAFFLFFGILSWITGKWFISAEEDDYSPAKPYRRDDDRIVKDIKNELTGGFVDAGTITISSRGGHVTLRGNVPTRRDRRVAEAMADFVLGVQDVRNEIHVLADEPTLAA